jgi:hypothetical protein
VDIGKGTKPLAVPADKDDSSRRKGKQSLGDRPADSPRAAGDQDRAATQAHESGSGLQTRLGE